jgi:hypothetical protein
MNQREMFKNMALPVAGLSVAPTMLADRGPVAPPSKKREPIPENSYVFSMIYYKPEQNDKRLHQRYFYLDKRPGDVSDEIILGRAKRLSTRYGTLAYDVVSEPLQQVKTDWSHRKLMAHSMILNHELHFHPHRGNLQVAAFGVSRDTIISTLWTREQIAMLPVPSQL